MKNISFDIQLLELNIIVFFKHIFTLMYLFFFPGSIPVSSFPSDSVYEVSAPAVDVQSHSVFKCHVQTGRGWVRTLCQEDVLMYREYIRNRYM